MPYHHPNDKSKVLACPDCRSVQLHPVKDYPGYLVSDRHVDLEDSLYNGDDYNYGWRGNLSYKEDYENRWQHTPIKRQNHFICEPCMEYWQENSYESDYIPIYPHKSLITHNIEDIKEPHVENPYDEVFG
jgi:hypothetical protein